MRFMFYSLYAFIKDVQAPGLLLDQIGKIWYAVVKILYYGSVKFQGALTTIQTKY